MQVSTVSLGPSVPASAHTVRLQLQVTSPALEATPTHRLSGGSDDSTTWYDPPSKLAVGACKDSK